MATDTSHRVHPKDQALFERIEAVLSDYDEHRPVAAPIDLRVGPGAAVVAMSAPAHATAAA